jgi:SAM-dependent methyltransferase
MPGALRAAFHRQLAEPETRGLDLDDPRTTEVRRRITRQKPFLRKIYAEWYTSISQSLPPGKGPVLELGSGPGFLSEFIPGLITSEVFPCEWVQVQADAMALPFQKEYLRAIVMTNVLHHLPRVHAFFAEASRCLRPGGAIVMIEPWVTAWSKLVYKKVHHEPFDPHAASWEFRSAGPLSGANGALPWMIFERDRERFGQLYPELILKGIQPMMPFCYLLSGGVSMRTLMPAWTYKFWRLVEGLLADQITNPAMFARIVVEKDSGTAA